MNVLDFIALILAAGGLVDVYFNGSIFERQRKMAEWNQWTLWSCDYCMNYQVPFWLLLLFYLPSLWLPYPWAWAWRTPIYWLGAAYAAWLINELRACRECDYGRTKRQEVAQEEYGGRGPQHVAAGSPDVLTLGGGPIPALTLPEQPPLLFCSYACREAYWRDLGNEHINQAVRLGAHDLPAGAVCAQCGDAIRLGATETPTEDYA